MLNKTFVINSSKGLHARPAACFVSEAGKFKSDIALKYKNREATAKSIISVVALGVETGSSVELMVNGEDQERAMERMEKFFQEEIQSF